MEQALEKGIENFVDAGNALSEIRDKRLYRFGFDTFEDYCQKRWQLSRSYAYRLIFDSNQEWRPTESTSTNKREGTQS